MRAKILHLSHTDVRSDSRILKELEAVNALADVDVFGLGIFTESKSTPSKIIQGVELNAVRLITYKFGFFPRPLRYAFNFIELFFVFLFYGLKIRPRIIHCHDTLVLPVGVVLKWLTRAYLVYDAHELESNKSGQTAVLSGSTLLLEKLSWPFVDHFVTVSQMIVEWYTENLGSKASTLILNSPQAKKNASEFAIESVNKYKYLRNKFFIPDHAKIFLYLGIIGKGRGIEVSLEAFSRSHPDAHFVMVGYGPLVPMAKEVASRSRNIHYHEAVPHDEVVTIASSADVGLCLIENVSLSDYYCLPNKLFEYAFAGLYVLSCNFPEIRRVVDRHGLGSTCDLDADSLVAEIERICIEGTHHETRDLELLSWNTQALRLRQTYSNLLAQ